MTARILAVVAALVAGAAHADAQPAHPTATPPNIVLIVADDLGYGDLASYGHKITRTPALDTLAKEGLRFTGYYAASALCSPSRASMMTGRAAYRTGVESWIPPNTNTQLQRGEITIATLLKQRGYRTVLSGKWHLNGGLDQKSHLQPNDHGFDHYLALHGWAIPHHENPTNFYRDGRPVGEMKGFAAQIVVDEALGWIEQRKKEVPFFLYLAFAEPHGTIASPASFNAQYAAFTDGTPDPMPNEDRPPSNMAVRGPGEYYANVAHMDHQVGRFLARLDQLGLRENTVIVFTSDNGPVTRDWRHWYELNLYGSAGDFRGRRNDLYEGGLRVPAIVRWPGRVPAGRVTDAPACGYDLLPTLARIAGAEVPRDRAIDGEDLGPLLQGKPFQRARPLFWEFDDFNGFAYAIRDGRWKLIANRGFTRVQLFDLQADPWEVVDRSGDAKAEAARLIAMVKQRHADIAADPLRPRAR
jgi:arylsulfatase A-like enzyme